MTDINLDNLPLAKGGQALNRVIGTQIDDEGVASLALFPLKTLSAAPGGRIAKLTMATTPAEPGDAQPARLTVYTDDGNSYPVDFTIPPGARGFSVADVECEQDAVTPGEASLVRLTVTLDNGQKLAPITLNLPPGKDSLTITDTSVTQGPVEAGKPSKVTVTFTHNDGSRTSYAYDAPPGPEGFVDGTRFVARDHGDMTLPTIHYGPDNSYSLTPQSDGNFVAYDDKRNVIFALNDKEGFLGNNKIATTQDVQAETKRAQTAEAALISGTESMAPIDVAGRSLHTNTQAGRPNYLDASGQGGVLAFYNDVTTETERAKAAEADTIKTHTTNVDAPVDLVSINKGGNDLAVRRQDTGEWKYFYPEDQSVHALTYSDADARPTTIRTLKSWWRGKPTLIVQNDGFEDFNAPSTIAVDDAINAETVRAQAAEANLLPLSGGTINGVITRTNGGVLPEVLLNQSGRVVIQTFFATVNWASSNPQWIKFPNQFKPGTIPYVFTQPTQEIIGDSQAWCSYIILKKSSSEINIDNTGARLQSYSYWLNNSSAGTTIVPITAIGIMP